MERIIGEINGESQEVLIVLIGSLHGNELEGVKAIDRTFKRLKSVGAKVNGKVIGIAGNLQAIETHQRFIDHDLNRCWIQEYIEKILQTPFDQLKHEDKELAELFPLIKDLLAEDYKQKFVIDLHTTSADNGNFLVYPGEVNERTVAKKLGLPMIKNLDDFLDGTTLLKYFSSDEIISFAFEGGQIGTEKAVDIHAEGIWQLLQLSGLIEWTEDLEPLVDPSENLPSLLNVVHRHVVKPNDGFSMKPGFKSFEPVNSGDLLASDKAGDIHSPEDGMIFMPLYQEAGNDGFFIVEEV